MTRMEEMRARLATKGPSQEWRRIQDRCSAAATVAGLDWRTAYRLSVMDEVKGPMRSVWMRMLGRA